MSKIGSMKKTTIICIILCLVTIFMVGCGGQTGTTPEYPPEAMRTAFFDALKQVVDGTENADVVIDRIEKYETQDLEQNPDNEQVYSFKCYTGFADPGESTITIWTDKNGEAKAMGVTTIGNEGRPALLAAVKVIVGDADEGVIKDEIFDFMYVDEANTTAQIENATVTKAFNNGGNVVTTGGISSVYSVCESAALEDKEFKEFFDKDRNALEIASLY